MKIFFKLGKLKVHSLELTLGSKVSVVATHCIALYMETVVTRAYLYLCIESKKGKGESHVRFRTLGSVP